MNWFEVYKLSCLVTPESGSIGHAASGCGSVEEVVVISKPRREGKKQQLRRTSTRGKEAEKSVPKVF